MPSRVLIAAMCVLVAVLPAVAAEPARDLTSMRVAVNDVVYVRTSVGDEIEGRFVRASPQAIVVIESRGGETTLPVERVLSVWKRGDRLRNGAVIGGLVGLAGGIFGQSGCTDCSGQIAIGIGLGVPLWAGLGALIDRQHVGRTLIYRAP